MTDLSDEEINAQIDVAYTALRTVVERLGEEGASTFSLGVALIGVAVEITLNVAGRKDGEALIKDIVSDRLATHVEFDETTH
jgi:hypothetical protein